MAFFTKKILLVIFFMSLVVMLGSNLVGYDFSIDWEVITTGEVIKFPAWSLMTDLATYEIPGETYILTEKYTGSEIKKITERDQLMFCLTWLGLCITLVAATYLKRYAFIAILALFVLFLNRLNLFEVGLFGIQTKIVVLIPFILFVSPLLFFHEYKKNTHFIIRLGSLLLATFIMILGIDNYPLFTDHLIAHSIFGFTICGLFFLFLLSEEIIFGILYITSSTKGGTNNHVHFLILSIIYLGNLSLYYLNMYGFFKNNFHYFNPFILLLLSSIVSIWSLKFKIQHVLKYGHSNAFYSLFLGLGITTMLFLALQMILGNDAIYEAFHYFILYFHIGFGVFFFFYIIGNFINPLIRGLSIHKIVYKEQNFPYLTARLGGLIVIIAFYFFAHQEPYRLLRAGYFNCLATTAKTEGNHLLSREYTLQASFLGYNTHLPNYLLGNNEKKRNQFAAKSYFLNANQRFPSPYALINYGNIDEQININKVQANYEAALRYQLSGEIRNNLGLLHLEKKDYEEALKFFEETKPSDTWNNAPLVNKWTTLKKMETIDTLSVVSDYNNGNFGVKSNILTTQNTLTNLKFQLDNLSNSELLHRQGYLINSAYLFHHDSIEGLIKEEINNSSNATSNNRLKKALVIHLYNKGDVNKAFMMLDYIQTNAPTYFKGEYLSMMGKFALEQQNYRLALDFFQQALEARHINSIFGKLESLAQLNKIAEIPSKLLIFLKKNPELTEQANNFLNKLKSFVPTKKNDRLIPKLDSMSVEELVILGRKNAFHEKQVLEIANKLKEQESFSSYELLVEAIEINPYSIPLLQAYIFMALDWNLIMYADQTMEELKIRLPHKKYKSFNEMYLKKKQILKGSEW